MMQFSWNSLKSKRLKLTRGVSFEEIIESELVEIVDHPCRGNQRVFLFKYKNYIWEVPFVRTETEIFLKTLYPSRKYTKIYKGRMNDEKN